MRTEAILAAMRRGFGLEEFPGAEVADVAGVFAFGTLKEACFDDCDMAGAILAAIRAEASRMAGERSRPTFWPRYERGNGILVRLVVLRRR